MDVAELAVPSRSRAGRARPFARCRPPAGSSLQRLFAAVEQDRRIGAETAEENPARCAMRDQKAPRRRAAAARRGVGGRAARRHGDDDVALQGRQAPAMSRTGRRRRPRRRRRSANGSAVPPATTITMRDCGRGRRCRAARRRPDAAIGRTSRRRHRSAARPHADVGERGARRRRCRRGAAATDSIARRVGCEQRVGERATSSIVQAAPSRPRSVSELGRGAIARYQWYHISCVCFSPSDIPLV